ncbi:nucleoid-associated protein [Desulfotignum phosphitoxidans]|uniref:37-kD nucleoid-associated bacterial protein n=1 Tax=Desulfotignum phosphitoxidans DSM 13687 TaxID=1286635 RepID=S0FWT1_9BACT|nr:nucleoid-associated protein [Desulfotignum phosphitoxidans]EMS79170.1 hypothetical protein Dpo_5c00930 [Desulfotignum phosphitoxidans DSM 13687]
MEEMVFHNNSLHHINLSSDKLDASPIADEQDLNDYIKTLIQGIRSSKDNRHFKFRSPTTEVVSAVKSIIDDENYEANTQIIADRLLSEEKKIQKKIEHLTKVQKGSLLQSYLEIDGKDFVIITKVDHNAFIDEFDLKKKVGLPFEKKVLKSCMIEIADNEIYKVVVYDTQSRISVYWWQDFLELDEINTNEKNTSTAFGAIDALLNRTVKKNYPADHLFLRNALIGYFKTQNEFIFDDMINYIIGVLKPDDSNLNMDKLKTDLEKLPAKYTFDRNFTITPEEITAKQKRTIIPLHEHIDLNIKSSIESLQDIVKPKEGDDGKKYIMIQSDQGFRHFHRAKKTDELH